MATLLSVARRVFLRIFVSIGLSTYLRDDCCVEEACVLPLDVLQEIKHQYHAKKSGCGQCCVNWGKLSAVW